MIQPRKLLTATTEKTPTENNTQWLTTSPTIEIGTILAIMLPTMPWAKTKGASGRRSLAPLVASAIAPSRGPSSSAAGAWTDSSNAATPTDTAMSAAHCATVGREPKLHLLVMIRRFGERLLLHELFGLAVHLLQGVDQLGGRRDKTCIIRATQYQRHAHLAVAETRVAADVEIVEALLQRAQRFGDDALGQVRAHGARNHRRAADQPMLHRLEHGLHD